MIPNRRSTYTVSITAFDERGDLDEGAMRAHLERLAHAGIGTYLGGSSPGQGNTLSMPELAKIFRIGRECFSGKASVRAMGVEPRSADRLIEIAKLVKETGLDAMQIYSLDMGHGAVPDEAELETYFRTVLDQVEVPAVLSTHQCMGWFMAQDLMTRLLADYPQIQGVHVTNPDLSYLIGVLQVAEACDREIEVHTGLHTQPLSALALGATGYLSGEGNLCPELCVSLIQCFEANDLQGMLNAHRKLLTLFPINFHGQSVRGLKAGMKHLGFPGWHHRPPVRPLSPSDEERVAALIDSLELARD